MDISFEIKNSLFVKEQADRTALIKKINKSTTKKKQRAI